MGEVEDLIHDLIVEVYRRVIEYISEPSLILHDILWFVATLILVAVMVGCFFVYSSIKSYFEAIKREEEYKIFEGKEGKLIEKYSIEIPVKIDKIWKANIQKYESCIGTLYRVFLKSPERQLPEEKTILSSEMMDEMLDSIYYSGLISNIAMKYNPTINKFRFIDNTELRAKIPEHKYSKIFEDKISDYLISIESNRITKE